MPISADLFARTAASARVSPLVAWMEQGDEHRGIRFARPQGAWELWSYARLAQRARAVAHGLARLGVRRDDVVCLAARSGPAFVTGFFGSLYAGATPSPIAPPMLFDNGAAYASYVTTILEAARPAIVLCDADRREEIARCAQRTPVRRVCAVDDLVADSRRDVALPGESGPPPIALLQFTSGSSASSRGVQVSCRALEANVDAIRQWLRWQNGDAFASWLPLHHDMGLVGALLPSVVGQTDLWLLEPEQFVRHPLRYLECFGLHRAALSVMPNFGLEYIVRRVRADALRGCDFSGWRGLVVGAELIDAGALDRFSALLAPFGFSPLTLLPAYGMAEATLAIAGLPLEEMWTGVPVEPASLSLHRDIVPQQNRRRSHVVVGCGRPIGGASIAVVDEAGRSVPDGRIGEILVRGPSVAAGYVDRRDAPSTALDHGLLKTGDAGFVRDGQLFVLGRLGDSLKVRGRVVFSEELEIAVGSLGVPRERVAALLGVHQGAATAVVLVERFHGCREDVLALIRLHAGDVAGVVVAAPNGTIARTTSGKPKRRELWRAFVDGTLPGLPHLGELATSARDGPRD